MCEKTYCSYELKDCTLGTAPTGGTSFRQRQSGTVNDRTSLNFNRVWRLWGEERAKAGRSRGFLEIILWLKYAFNKYVIAHIVPLNSSDLTEGLHHFTVVKYLLQMIVTLDSTLKY